jgi:hypothetical protein
MNSFFVGVGTDVVMNLVERQCDDRRIVYGSLHPIVHYHKRPSGFWRSPGWVVSDKRTFY